MNDSDQSEIDTSTADGFREVMNRQGFSVARASILIGASEATINAWIKEKRPVHPTAARMLEWISKGYRPENYHMSGADLKSARAQLGLSSEAMANLLDVEISTLEKWESDFRGPPAFVATGIRWLLLGFRPPEFPTAAPPATDR